MITFTIHTPNTLSDDTYRTLADFVWDHGWGRDYPLDPLDEIQAALALVCGRTEDGDIAAIGSIGRGYDYDGTANDLFWMAHAVVAPTHRGRGLYRRVWDLRTAYAQQHGLTPLHLCTTNPGVASYAARQGWIFDRTITDPRDNTQAAIWRSHAALGIDPTIQR